MYVLTQKKIGINKKKVTLLIIHPPPPPPRLKLYVNPHKLLDPLLLGNKEYFTIDTNMYFLCHKGEVTKCLDRMEILFCGVCCFIILHHHVSIVVCIYVCLLTSKLPHQSWYKTWIISKKHRTGQQ